MVMHLASILSQALAVVSVFAHPTSTTTVATDFTSNSPTLVRRDYIDELKWRCPTGNDVYIIVARGTNEDGPYGKTQEVARMIEKKLPGSFAHGVDYPASFYWPTYWSSVGQGMDFTKDLISRYVAQCGAKSRIVLLGFSQGAMIMTNLLGCEDCFTGDQLDAKYQKYSEFYVYAISRYCPPSAPHSPAGVEQRQPKLTLLFQSSLPPSLETQPSIAVSHLALVLRPMATMRENIPGAPRSWTI